MEDETTDPNQQTPYEQILEELNKLSKITNRSADRALEVHEDIKRIFEHLTKLQNQIAFAFGVAATSLIVSLFAMFMALRK